MRIEYDRDVDAISVTVSDDPSVSTRAVNDLWLLDYGAHGELVGMEFFAVSGGIRISSAPLHSIRINTEQFARQLVEAGASLVIIADWDEVNSTTVNGVGTRTLAMLTTWSGFQRVA